MDTITVRTDDLDRLIDDALYRMTTIPAKDFNTDVEAGRTRALYDDAHRFCARATANSATTKGGADAG